MSLKFPNNMWAERNGQNYVNADGEITETANNWLVELSKLSREQIKVGMRDLAYLKNPAFPPTAIEFVKHSLDMGAEDCANEILECINRKSDSDWWWQTIEAFNVYLKLNYNPANNKTKAQILEEIKVNYRRLDMSNLKPIPKKAAVIPYSPPSKIERNRGKFQSLMFHCINKIRPDLFLSAPTNKTKYTSKQIIQMFMESGRPQEDFCDFVAEARGMKKDQKVLDLFTPHRSNELMIKWYKSDQPDMVNFLRTHEICV